MDAPKWTCVIFLGFIAAGATTGLASLTADGQGNVMLATGGGKFLVNGVDVLGQLSFIAMLQSANVALNAEVSQLRQNVTDLTTRVESLEGGLAAETSEALRVEASLAVSGSIAPTAGPCCQHSSNLPARAL